MSANLLDLDGKPSRALYPHEISTAIKATLEN